MCAKSRPDSKWSLLSLDWSLVDPFCRIPPDFFLIALFFFSPPLLKLFCLFLTFFLFSFYILSLFTIHPHHSLFFVLARPLST